MADAAFCWLSFVAATAEPGGRVDGLDGKAKAGDAIDAIWFAAAAAAAFGPREVMPTPKDGRAGAEADAFAAAAEAAGALVAAEAPILAAGLDLAAAALAPGDGEPPEGREVAEPVPPGLLFLFPPPAAFDMDEAPDRAAAPMPPLLLLPP